MLTLAIKPPFCRKTFANEKNTLWGMNWSIVQYDEEKMSLHYIFMEYVPSSLLMLLSSNMLYLRIVLGTKLTRKNSTFP